MTEKLKNLRTKCTTKQANFVELVVTGLAHGLAYQEAGYKPKTLIRAQQEASRLLTTNKKVIEYLNELKEEHYRKMAIGRGVQLARLNKLYDIAIDQNNVTAATGVVREMNEMLGYHREAAPNPEREQARKALLHNELRELERLCRQRTAELSQPRRVVSKELPSPVLVGS